MTPETPQSMGGVARAEILPPERRSEIASRAASKRWSMPKAAYEGDLVLGDQVLQSAVLEDGTRVLISKAVLQALGRTWSGTPKRLADSTRPYFIAAKNLEPYVGAELDEHLTPIEYKGLRGAKAIGYKAEMLPLLCEAYIAADNAGVITTAQRHIVEQARILYRSLAKVGIIGLVDEATGYQDFRKRYELQQILSSYISEELLPWQRRFPVSFYEQMYRVWGWEFKPGDHRRNSYVGHLTNSLIYKQLPPGVLEELRLKNPVDPDSKRRKKPHHVFLTPEIGHPHLHQQITAVTTLLRATPAARPDMFKVLFENAFPSDQKDLFPEYDTVDFSKQKSKVRKADPKPALAGPAAPTLLDGLL
jgi:hypothetical protein